MKSSVCVTLILFFCELSLLAENQSRIPHSLLGIESTSFVPAAADDFAFTGGAAERFQQEEIEAYARTSSQDCGAPNETWNLIRSVNDLRAVQSYGRYWLCNDIDLEFVEWQPLPGFLGIFEGNGHRILNLKITRPRDIQSWSDPNNFNIGLFSNIEAGAVYNLRLHNIDVTGVGFVGGLAGSIFSFYTRVENVEITGRVSGISFVGLLAGSASILRASNISVGGVVDAVDYSGGFIGYALGVDAFQIGTTKWRPKEDSKGASRFNSGARKNSAELNIYADNMAGGFAGYFESGWTFITPNGFGTRNRIIGSKINASVNYQAFNDAAIPEPGTNFGGLVGLNFYKLVSGAEDGFESPLIVQDNDLRIKMQVAGVSGGLIGQVIGSAYEDTLIQQNQVQGKIRVVPSDRINLDPVAGGLMGISDFVTARNNRVDLQILSYDGFAAGLVGIALDTVSTVDNYVGGAIEGNPSLTAGLVTSSFNSFSFHNFVTGSVHGDALFSSGMLQSLGNHFLINSLSGEKNSSQFLEAGIHLADAQNWHDDNDLLFSNFDFSNTWKQAEGDLPSLRNLESECLYDLNGDQQINQQDFLLALDYFHKQIRVTAGSYGNEGPDHYLDAFDLKALIRAMRSAEICNQPGTVRKFV